MAKFDSKDAQFFSFSSMPFQPLYNNVSSRLMAGEKLMFVEHRVKKGHTATGDKHENEQLTLILSGSLKVTIGKESHVLKNGDAVLIPSNVVHNIEVLEDSVVIEVFSPPRKEWLNRMLERNPVP